MNGVRIPILLGLLFACSGLPAQSFDASRTELSASRALWERSELRAHYRYGYQKYCDCHRDTPPETIVSVDGDIVVRVHHLHAGSDREVPAREGSLELYWTIDSLFDLLESALERKATMRASYDATDGYPTRLYIDYDQNLVGDELDVRLTRVEQLN